MLPILATVGSGLTIFLGLVAWGFSIGMGFFVQKVVVDKVSLAINKRRAERAFKRHPDTEKAVAVTHTVNMAAPRA